MKAELVVVKGAKPITVHLKRLPAVIGRSDAASLRFSTTKISRKHCEIYEADDELYVRDLGSTNGTFVNKRKIADTTQLATGDLLKVGPVTMKIVCPEKKKVSTELDSFIDLDKEEVEPDGSMSIVNYRETSEGSFIDIAEEAPAKESPAKDAKKATMKNVKKAPSKDDKKSPKKEAASADEEDVMGFLDDDDQPKVEGGDSALNDFFKSMD